MIDRFHTDRLIHALTANVCGWEWPSGGPAPHACMLGKVHAGDCLCNCNRRYRRVSGQSYDLGSGGAREIHKVPTPITNGELWGKM